LELWTYLHVFFIFVLRIASGLLYKNENTTVVGYNFLIDSILLHKYTKFQVPSSNDIFSMALMQVLVLKLHAR
jgi:hypothetical protein